MTKIETFNQLNELLAKFVESKDFLDKFYRIYDIQPDMPLAALHDQIFHFLSDEQFGYPVHLAREELMGWDVSRRTGAHASSARRTAVQSYRVNVGNPFPGINYGKAHHCVDLIYIYDCFADALRAADQALPAGFVTNASLVETMQDDWIRFITAPSTGDQYGLATIYNADRTSSVIEMASDKDWVERMARFDLLDKNRTAAQQVIKALTGSGHTF